MQLQSIVGMRISEFLSGAKKTRLMPDMRDAAKIQDAVISQVGRRAKLLLISLDSGATVVFHLGMTGSFRIESTTMFPAKLHDHFSVSFENGKSLVFNDPRRFGGCFIINPGESSEIITALGIEPFDETEVERALAKAAKGSKTPIKSLLMDNSVVVGVGNIYAAEVLFATKTRPTKPAGKITKAKMTLIAKTVVEKINEAILAGGSSTRDYKHVNGDTGHAQELHKVYGKKGEACPNGCGAKIERVTIGGRGSFFCPKCQK